MLTFTRVTLSGAFLVAILSGADKELALVRNSYAIRAGSTSVLSVTSDSLDFIRKSTKIATTTLPQDGHEVFVGLSAEQRRPYIAVPVSTPPGTRSVTLVTTSSSGEQRSATLHLEIQSQPQLAAATEPPVVLMNGWQFLCTGEETSKDTFGNLNCFL